MIYGDSGTGKDIVAREIHKYSNFNDGPFIAINAALMEPENIEKEFFGQDENNIEKQGYFELASNGTIFIDEVNPSPNVKLDLGKIINSADKYVQKIVIPSKKETKNILLWRPTDISEIESVVSRGGNWIILIKSAVNVLKGDNFVFVYPELVQNKIIVKKGEVISSEVLLANDLNNKYINSKIKNLLRKTREKIKLKGSIVNEISTKQDFIKKIRDSLKINQDIKYLLEVVSLKDSKTADPIIVELNVTKL